MISARVLWMPSALMPSSMQCNSTRQCPMFKSRGVGACSPFRARLQCEKEIVAIGGLDAVVGCMKRKSSEEGIQECACVVLRNLAMDTANIAPIMEGGGLDTVVKAMKLHATIPSLQNRCFVHSRF